MGVYDRLTRSSGITDDDIKQGFYYVQNELNSIQSMIDEAIKLLTDAAIRNQYVTAERVITESLRCYNAYTNMTNP